MDLQKIIEWLARVDAQKISFTVYAGDLKLTVWKGENRLDRYVSLQELSQAQCPGLFCAQVIDDMEHQLGVPVAQRIDDMGKRTRPRKDTEHE